MATLSEVLNITQRLKKSRDMKKLSPRLKIARSRAMKRMASREVLMKRARKHARNLMLKKLLKNVPKDELSMARKAEIEKRLDTPAMKMKIDKLAVKLLPKIRKMEQERKQSGGDDKND